MVRHARLIAGFVLFATLLFVTPATAQSCGSPPDPRWNTSGYASWCSCMGGSYNYQTTACTGARAPSTGERAYSSEGWGCRAVARNGAWGNSWGFASEAEARDRAVAECRSRPGARSCAVSFCQRGTSAENPPSTRQTARQTQSAPGAPSGDIGCRAVARNGASGFSFGFGVEADARQRAIAECRQRSRGQACSISFCQHGTSADNPPGPTRPSQTQPETAEQLQPGVSPGAGIARPQAGPAAPQYFCGVCERKLDSDLRTGLSSARPRTFVQQVVAGYQNCKLKAWKPCFLGDIQVRTVTNACSGFTRDTDFRACLGRTLGQ